MNLRLSLASSAVALAFAAVVAQGCSSSTEGGPVSGAQDAHCGTKIQAVDLAACSTATAALSTKSVLRVLHEGHDEDAGADGGDGGDAGAAPDDDEYGATMYNASGSDDDCKYKVSFTSTAVAKDKDVTFTVTLASLVDGTPMPGAEPYLENHLGEHIGPATTQASAETTPGTYTIGPVRFDQSGQWTVRFHFYGQCESVETDDSPHAHAAFYVNVP